MTTMTVTNTDKIEVGDKIRFLIKGVGVFVGYVKYLTDKAISLKGCRLLRAIKDEYKMNNLDISYYKENQTHTLLTREIDRIEVLEKTPF